MAFESIQIFACDHRKNIQWNLPYVRLGNYQSDAVINIKDDEEIAPYQLLLSEGAQMWWIDKHYNEIGDPGYIGLMHYRRFFSFVCKMPIVNISANAFNPIFCAKPLELLSIILKNKLDGLTFCPLPITSDNEHKFIDVLEQLKFLSKDGMNIPAEVCDKAFKLFLQNCKDNVFKQLLKQAMSIRNSYVCNIFILKKDLFHEFCSIAFPVFIELKSMFNADDLKNIHPRFMGYILERFTSTYLHAIQLRGQKIGIIPLMTIDAHIHQKWSKSDAKN